MSDFCEAKMSVGWSLHVCFHAPAFFWVCMVPAEAGLEHAVQLARKVSMERTTLQLLPSARRLQAGCKQVEGASMARQSHCQAPTLQHVCS